MHRFRPAVALATVLTLISATACTGSSGGRAGSAPGKPATITFWHGWSQPNEVKAINDSLARFKKIHPEITVKAVGNIGDEKITQGIRAGNGPDVVSTFTTDNVGQFCGSGSWLDLKPFLDRSGIDPQRIFPKPLLEYTQYKNRRCALPLLTDVWGLYYNKKMLAEAGLSGPPRTASDLKRYAVKLTTYNPDGSIKRLGFMPNFRSYENSPWHWMAAWKPAYFDANGMSQIAKDPAATAFLKNQTDLIKALGGYAKLERFRHSLGEEFSPQNAFETGKVAMQLDGEWRTAMMAADKVSFDYGTAPLPVPDERSAAYGGGYLSGTIIGIARTSKEQNAAWELVKFLTTDTDALVSFANAIHNVPSTFASLKSPALTKDPHFRTFVDMFADPNSTTTPASPNGGQYLTAFQEFGFKWEAGSVPDLAAGLTALDKRINADLKRAG